MKLTTEQTDALTEIVNIGVGRAAASLSQLVDERIDLHVPRVEMCRLPELSSHMHAHEGQPDTLVVQAFNGVVNGHSLLGFSRSSGIKLAQILGGGDESLDHLDFDLCGILEEVGNIVLNGVLGSISNMMETSLSYTPPELLTDTSVEDVFRNLTSTGLSTEEYILIADAHFGVARRQISGSLIIAFEMNGVEVVLTEVAGLGGTV